MIETILEKKESFNILGAAGTGKSYLIKGIQKELEKREKSYISLAPTNKAANIINGITLHKFVSKIRNNKNMDRFFADYIFVDEISMMKEQFYKFLIYIKKKKPDTILFASSSLQ